MLIFRSLQEIPPDFGPSLVTIGNFDGVHRGHRCVLAELAQRARQRKARSVAVTFDPHPVRVLRPQQPLTLITPLEQKLELLQTLGIDPGLDAVLVLTFTQALSQLSAQEFAQTVIRDALHAIEVHEGENFRFGQDASANVDTLTRLGANLGFTVHAHPAQMWRGQPISSSRIRAAIEQGDMRSTRQLLGRPFALQSTPAPGRGYGARYTVPTINLEGRKVAFLARHGRGHRILPSDLNFRANIYAMKQLGVTSIFSVSAVGSLKKEHAPGGAGSMEERKFRHDFHGCTDARDGRR